VSASISPVVVLDHQEAFLIAHVLAVFERLLRQSELSPDQLRLLAADGVVGPGELPDVEMAELAAEAAEPLRRQL
jgi:hypothetical protein